MARQRTQQVTVLLLKDGLTAYDDAIEEPSSLDAYDVDPNLSLPGRLYIQRRTPTVPNWLEFVQSGVSGDIGQLANSGTAAVLIAERAGRLFAVTFGYGRSLIESELIVRDFGLKVVLNVVDPDKLRSIELRAIEDMVMSRRTDASRGAAVGAFGLDPGRDIMKGVAGQPTDRSLYGRQIVGSDAVVVRLPIQFGDLGDVFDRLVAAYDDSVYKLRFGWIDDVKVVKSAALRDELDDALITALRNSTPGPYVAPPEMLPWNNVEFSFTGDRGDRHDDLDLDDYLANQDINTLEIQTLHQHKVRVFPVAGSTEQTHWSVYDTLVFETTIGGRAFVLSESQWFEVAASLVDSVREGLERIPLSSLRLPLAKRGEWEAAYNARAVAADGNNRALLDKVLSQVAREQGLIEMCDIATSRGEFVHVKRKTQSATLSHLFSQGRVAADVFKRDPGVREELRARLRGTLPTLATRIPGSGDPVHPEEFEVVYGIITDKTTDFPHTLPFFSRLNLLRAYEFLTVTLGFHASAMAIDYEP